MKKLLAVLLIGMTAFAADAQKLPDMGLYKIYVSETDKNIQAEINPVESELKIQTDRSYYWYSSGKIKITQGGYSGKLLNGQYNEFYLNKNLKEQGEFKKGLKNGLWKSWTENGKLVQAVNWKNGIRNGGFESYDEKGNLVETGTYRNDKLARTKTIGPDGRIEEKTYGTGEAAAGKKGFWSKLNIFKKK